MAVTSTGAAEQIAVATLFSYDVWKRYIQPDVDGRRIVLISREPKSQPGQPNAPVYLFNIFAGCLYPQNVLLPPLKFNRIYLSSCDDQPEIT